jgi:hypothetical protein
MADMNTSIAEETPTLSKKHCGRLKKLRKRIQETKYGSDMSGLTSSSDLVELNELHQQAASNDEIPLSIGPSIRLRKDKQGDKWQNAEGSDQRDVLWKMVQHLSAAPKKRKRDKDKPIRIPPWCTLHNPCTVQSVAVVELCVNDECDWNTVKEHLPIVSSLIDGQDKSKVALPIETRWFQCNQPRSITDILMYISKIKESQNENGTDSVGEVDSCDNLLRDVTVRLQHFVMKPKDLKKERFPVAVDGAERGKVHQNRKEFQGKVDLPSLNDAKEIVQRCNVEIKEDAIMSTFVTTSLKQVKEHESKSPRVFSLDCEMVQTAKGYELARVTLLQLTGVDHRVQDEVSYIVVMDEFVKPYGQILDYKTEYSGVTATILQDVTTRLEQIQAAVISIVDQDDILLGHSLENDLRALCLVHDTVVDTAVVFRAKKERRKYSLRHLSATLLGKKIQSNHGADGHCSEEDAAASLNLAVRRAREGESFRIKEPGEDRLHLLETISEGPVVCVGPADWLTTHVTPFQSCAHALTCEAIADPNRKAVVAWLKSENRRAKLVWASFGGDPKESNDSFFAKANNLLSEVTKKMLPGTLLLVSIQSGYARAVKEAKKRKIFMDPRSSLGWTAQQEEAYQRHLNFCRSGITFWIGDSCVQLKSTKDEME